MTQQQGDTLIAAVHDCIQRQTEIIGTQQVYIMVLLAALLLVTAARPFWRR